MPRLIVALGGNLGDVEQTFVQVLRLLPQHQLNVVTVSRLYDTAPWPAELAEQPPYINAVCMVRSSLGPWAVLRRLKKIERLLGRRPSKRVWQPRTIDLDLIAYQGVVMRTKKLTLPHPRAHLRRFVIGPMMDVAPSWPIGTTRQASARSLWVAMNCENGDISAIRSWQGSNLPI